MRRNDKEITDRQEIESIIKRALVCRIGLSEDDAPYVVPVNYGYKDNQLYFHSAAEGRKIEILKKNNRVCFEMDIDHELVRAETPCKWGMKYRSVIGFGKAFSVHDLEKKRQALSIITAHYSSESFDFPQDEMEKVVVIRIEIENMTGKKSGY